MILFTLWFFSNYKEFGVNKCISVTVLAGHGHHTDTSVLHKMISAYTPVGINYNTDTYAACVQLAVLDYNENIGKLAKPGL